MSLLICCSSGVTAHCLLIAGWRFDPVNIIVEVEVSPWKESENLLCLPPMVSTLLHHQRVCVCVCV